MSSHRRLHPSHQLSRRRCLCPLQPCLEPINPALRSTYLHTSPADCNFLLSHFLFSDASGNARLLGWRTALLCSDKNACFKVELQHRIPRQARPGLLFQPKLRSDEVLSRSCSSAFGLRFDLRRKDGNHPILRTALPGCLNGCFRAWRNASTASLHF